MFGSGGGRLAEANVALRVKSMVLDADTLKLIQDLHQELCRELTALRGTPPDEPARELLAHRLVSCAGNGERDPERLKAYARSRDL